MKVEQFYDKGLAHASYAILNGGKVAVIDPGRDPQPYYDFAQAHNAQIVAVIETHPHADFISSHLEISRDTGAVIYVSQLLGADYPHQAFDDGDEIALGDARLISMNTPGHSPDSISIVLRDASGKDHAVFTGDTLFIGDVGRPDLREGVGNIRGKREDLARQMFYSTRDKLMKLDPEVLVYPAHGAGSLCGKNLSSDTVSTIGRELKENYALQPMSEEEFVKVLLEGQPFMPKYFGFDVELNKKGADSFEESIKAVPRIDRNARIEPGVLVIDARPHAVFKKSHVKGAFNLQNGGKFETWLGSIVGPNEPFYLIADTEEVLEDVIRKTAKIGYEGNIKGALLAPDKMEQQTSYLDVKQFNTHPEGFNILDVRNEGEYAGGAIFEAAQHIPLPELRERASEVPTDKPIVVHCAAGYRSAAGASILEAAVGGKVKVFDFGEEIEAFKQKAEA